MSKALTPLADRVIAVREKAPTKTAGGLYLPDNAKEKATTALVESVGPDVKAVKAGDRIIYKEYSVTEIKVGDSQYLIVKEEDILAKVGK